MARTPDEARRFLLDRVDFERRPARTPGTFKLDGIRRLLAALGDPHERVPVVHVAGTKGKGSTAAMIATGLTANGLRTGLYTSPHMTRIEERFRIDGEIAPEERFVELVDRLEHACRELPEPPTFFESVTAIAWLHFATAEVDIAVLEVGIGGRLDSTNVCRPLVTVITNVSLDHTRLLGDTPAKIAAEKAGIVKPGIPCISGVLEPSAREVVRATCATHDAPLWEWTGEITADVNRIEDVFPATHIARVRTPVREWPELRVPLAGAHQVGNAALAVAALDRLADAGWSIHAARATRGIVDLTWPLRFEAVRSDPLVVCDAAHNEASIAALVDALTSWRGGRRIAIFAAARDKDHAAMLRLLVPAFDEIILTRFVGNPRAVPPTDLERTANEIVESMRTTRADAPVGRISIRPAPASAWELAESLAEPTDIICATGSFFLAAEVRELLANLP